MSTPFFAGRGHARRAVDLAVMAALFVLALLGLGPAYGTAQYIVTGVVGLALATVLAIIIEATQAVGGYAPAADGQAGNPHGWSLNVPALSGSPIALPDLSTLLTVDPIQGFSAAGVLGAFVIVFSLLLQAGPPTEWFS